MDPGNSSHLIIALGNTNGGIYSTINGGANWVKLNSTNVFNDIYRIAADPNNFNTLYVSQRRSGSYAGGVYKSTDGGTNWSLILGVSANEYPYGMAVNPANSNFIYVAFADNPYHDNATGAGILRSTDGGLNWQKEWNGLSQLDAWRVVVNPNNPAQLYVGTAGCASFVGYDQALANPTLSIQRAGPNLQLDWPLGTLLEATDLSGPWTTNPAASSVIVTPTGAQRFFRLKVR